MKGSDKDMMKKLSAALLAFAIAAGSSATMIGSADEPELTAPSAPDTVQVIDDDTPEEIQKPMNADLVLPTENNAVQAPDQPVALKATKTSAGLKLTWQKSNNCDGYYVYREHPMGDAMGYNFIYLSGKNTDSYIWSDYNDNYKDWVFAVVAYNIDGNGYVFSKASLYNEIVDETASSTGIPSTPYFTSYNKTYDAVRLFWNPVACAGYDVEYNTNTGRWASIGTVSSSNSNVRISRLEPSITYQFRMRAYNLDASGNKVYSGYSSVYSATTTARSGGAAVAAPTKTSMFSSSVSSNQVTVGWNAVSCSGYQLYYNVTGNSNDWTLAGNLGNNVTSYTLSGLNANSNVWFTVRAFNRENDGTPVYAAFADNLKVTTSSSSSSTPTPAVGKPAKMTITKIGRSTNAFRTYWNAVACDGYEVWYNSTGNSGDWVKVNAVIPSNATNYRISGLTPGHDYWVTVRAYTKNSNGTYNYGEYAGNVKVTTKSSSSSSTTPTNPTVKAPAQPVINKTTKTYDAVRINWNSIACSGYEVYLNSTGGNNDWKLVATLGSNATTYRAEKLQPNHTYWLTIRAFNKDSSGNKKFGSFASNVTVTTKAKSSSGSSNVARPAGTSIYKTSVSKNAVRLNWNWTNCNGYLVYQLVNGNTWKLVKGIKNPATTTCRITGLYSGSTYFFKVRTFNWGANNKKVTGSDSAVVTATTKK